MKFTKKRTQQLTTMRINIASLSPNYQFSFSFHVSCVGGGSGGFFVVVVILELHTLDVFGIVLDLDLIASIYN